MNNCVVGKNLKPDYEIAKHKCSQCLKLKALLNNCVSLFASNTTFRK